MAVKRRKFPQMPSTEFVMQQVNNAIDAAGSSITLGNGYTLADGSLPKALLLENERELVKRLNIDGERNEKTWTGFQFKADMKPHLATGLELRCVNGVFKIDILKAFPYNDVIIYMMAAAYQI